MHHEDVTRNPLTRSDEGNQLDPKDVKSNAKALDPGILGNIETKPKMDIQRAGACHGRTSGSCFHLCSPETCPTKWRLCRAGNDTLSVEEPIQSTGYRTKEKKSAMRRKRKGSSQFSQPRSNLVPSHKFSSSVTLQLDIHSLGKCNVRIHDGRMSTGWNSERTRGHKWARNGPCPNTNSPCDCHPTPFLAWLGPDWDAWVLGGKMHGRGPGGPPTPGPLGSPLDATKPLS